MFSILCLDSSLWSQTPRPTWDGAIRTNGQPLWGYWRAATNSGSETFSKEKCSNLRTLITMRTYLLVYRGMPIAATQSSQLGGCRNTFVPGRKCRVPWTRRLSSPITFSSRTVAEQKEARSCGDAPRGVLIIK